MRVYTALMSLVGIAEARRQHLRSTDTSLNLLNPRNHPIVETCARCASEGGGRGFCWDHVSCVDASARCRHRSDAPQSCHDTIDQCKRCTSEGGGMKFFCFDDMACKTTSDTPPCKIQSYTPDHCA